MEEKMSNLIRWNPFREMVSMSEAMNKLFDDAWVMPRNGGFFRNGGPALDMVENADNIVVTAELPGFKPEDIDIQLEGSVLTLHGEVKEENEKQEGQYHVKERRQNSFARAVQLPTNVVVDKAKAEFKDGILTLTLPKDEVSKAKKISITAKSGK